MGSFLLVSLGVSLFLVIVLVICDVTKLWDIPGDTFNRISFASLIPGLNLIVVVILVIFIICKGIYGIFDFAWELFNGF